MEAARGFSIGEGRKLHRREAGIHMFFVFLRAVVERGFGAPPSRLSIYKERQRKNLS
jgi:hypothetical protein